MLIAPRRLMFAAHHEDLPGYLGREFHCAEVADWLLEELRDHDDELIGSYEAMYDIYDHGNLVELNSLIDVAQGADYLVNDYIHNSAVTRDEANFIINFNYVHDTEGAENEANNAVFSSDGDQDLTTDVGNMISGIGNDDLQPEEMPIMLSFAMYAEAEFNQGTSIQAIANAVVDSDYPELAVGLNYELEGTVTKPGSGRAVDCPIHVSSPGTRVPLWLR